MITYFGVDIFPYTPSLPGCPNAYGWRWEWRSNETGLRCYATSLADAKAAIRRERERARAHPVAAEIVRRFGV